MKNITKIALLVALGGGAIVPAFAQDNFPDVPENHWAFEALDNLKREGIVVGYPDGRYRGTRFMTRYEFAVAINAAYKKLMGMYSGLSARVDELEKRPGSTTVDLSDIKADIAKMKGWGDDIASLQKMAGTFEKQLASLGVDVEQLKKDLKACADACGKGGNGLPFSMSGDVNAVVFAGNSRDGYQGMSKDGHVWGLDGGGNDAGLTRDYRVYHEIGLTMAGKANDNVKWNADLAIGNLLDGIGSLSTPGVYKRVSNTDLYVSKLSASFNESLLGLGFGAEVGRVGVKVSPYMLQRPDFSAYTDLPGRWDDGEWRIDGAKLGFNFGGATVGVFGGKHVNQRSSSGGNIMPFPGLGVAVDSTLGVTVGFNLGQFFKGTLANLWHDSGVATAAGVQNRQNVFGVDGTVSVAGFNVNGGYAQSKPSQNTHNIAQTLNKSYYANTSFSGGNWSLGAEYRKVEANYMAAGAWRRIGTAWLPTDIETITGMFNMKLSGNMDLGYTGEFGKVNKSTTDDKVQSHNVTLNYNLSNNWKVKLGYEDVKAETLGVRQKWATLGLGYNLGANTTLGFAYEYGSVNNGAGGFGAGAPGAYKGGMLSSQLSIKF